MTTFCFARFEEFNSLTCSLLDVNIFLFDLSSRFAPTSVDEANTFDVEDGNTPQHPCGRCANGAGDPKDHHEQHGSLVPSGQQVTGPQHGWFAALVNALEYTGFQACSKMPMEIQHHLGQILEGQHPLQQGVQIPYWGSKTPERLRGNIAVLEYINSSTNFGRFVEEFNNYHGGTMEEDQQMEG